VIFRSQHSSQRARDHLVGRVRVYSSGSPQFILYHDAEGLHLEFTKMNITGRQRFLTPTLKSGTCPPVMFILRVPLQRELRIDDGPGI